MPFDIRLIVISLATFAAASTVISIAVPWLVRRTRAGSPHARAQALFRLRLLPVSIAFAAMVQGIVSFVVFEPRGEGETFGWILVGLAISAIALAAVGTARLIRGSLATRRALRTWLATADAIDLEGVRVPVFAVDSLFPIVALVGIVRPRLVIARSVLAHCPPDELKAILAHEQRHLTQRDNLRRAVMLWLPDVLSLLRPGRTVAGMWHETAEAVADDAATALGPAGRVNLASALLRVARLAPPGGPVMSLPASALYRGEDIASRVRRLLDPPTPALPTGLSGWRGAMMSGGLIVGGGLALHAMHEIVETVASFLP